MDMSDDKIDSTADENSRVQDDSKDALRAVGSFTFSIPDLGIMKILKAMDEPRRRYFSPTEEEELIDQQAATRRTEEKAKAKLEHGIEVRMLNPDMIVVTDASDANIKTVYVPGLTSEEIDFGDNDWDNLSQEQKSSTISKHFQEKYGSAGTNPNTIPPMSFGHQDDVISIVEALAQVNNQIVASNREAMLNSRGYVKDNTGRHFFAESADFISKLSPLEWKKHQKAMDKIISPEMRAEILNSTSKIPVRNGKAEMREVALKDAPKELKKDIEWLKEEIEKRTELSPFGLIENSKEEREINEYRAQLAILEPLHEALDDVVKTFKDPRSTTAKYLDNTSAALTSLATASAAGLAAWGLSQPAFHAAMTSYFTGTTGSATLQGGFGIAWGNISAFFGALGAGISGAGSTAVAGAMLAAGPIPIIGWVAAGIGLTILAVAAYKYINKHYGDEIKEYFDAYTLENTVTGPAKAVYNAVTNALGAGYHATTGFLSAVGGVLEGQRQAFDRMQAKDRLRADIFAYAPNEFGENSNLTKEECTEFATTLEEMLVLFEVQQEIDYFNGQEKDGIKSNHLEHILRLRNLAQSKSEVADNKEQQKRDLTALENEIQGQIELKISDMGGKALLTFKDGVIPSETRGELQKLYADLKESQQDVVDFIRDQFKKEKLNDENHHHMLELTHKTALEMFREADTAITGLELQYSVLPTYGERASAAGTYIKDSFKAAGASISAGVGRAYKAVVGPTLEEARAEVDSSDEDSVGLVDVTESSHGGDQSTPPEQKEGFFERAVKFMGWKQDFYAARGDALERPKFTEQERESRWNTYLQAKDIVDGYLSDIEAGKMDGNETRTQEILSLAQEHLNQAMRSLDPRDMPESDASSGMSNKI
jgi:hypothetical protein